MLKIRISTKCIETWPCRHMVALNDGKTLEMNWNTDRKDAP